MAERVNKFGNFLVLHEPGDGQKPMYVADDAVAVVVGLGERARVYTYGGALFDVAESPKQVVAALAEDDSILDEDDDDG